MTSEEAWRNCLLLLYVLNFYCDVISGHAHKQRSCNQAPPLGYISTINLIWGIFVSKISWLFHHHYVLFHLAQLSIHGSSGKLFPKCWNWQICHTHLAFKLPFCIFSGKLQTFPKVKSKTIEFLLDWTKQYTQVLFAETPSEKRAAKQPLCSLFRNSWHVLHYTVHMTPLCALWKLLKALGRTTSSVTDVRLTSRFTRGN